MGSPRKTAYNENQNTDVSSTFKNPMNKEETTKYSRKMKYAKVVEGKPGDVMKVKTQKCFKKKRIKTFIQCLQMANTLLSEEWTLNISFSKLFQRKEQCQWSHFLILMINIQMFMLLLIG